MEWLEVFIGVSLIGLVAWEVLLYSPPIQAIQIRLGVTVRAFHASAQASSLKIGLTHSSADRSLRLVAFPLSDRPIQPRDIFVFVDSSFPTAGASPTSVQGIFDHLAAELDVHGFPGRIRAVTEGGLRDLLTMTSFASQRVLVIMTGVTPSSVFSTRTDLISPWVKAGGLFVWGGGTLGYWTAAPGQALLARNVVGEGGTVQLLGVGVVKYPWADVRVADRASDFGSALNVAYRLANVGLARDPILARGGLDLGWDLEHFLSIGYLPRGAGGYLIFGGAIVDEESVAQDLTRLLLTNSLNAAGPVAAKDVYLTPSRSVEDVVWDLPFPPPKAGIMLAALDPNPDGVFIHSEIVGR